MHSMFGEYEANNPRFSHPANGGMKHDRFEVLDYCENTIHHSRRGAWKRLERNYSPA